MQGDDSDYDYYDDEDYDATPSLPTCKVLDVEGVGLRQAELVTTISEMLGITPDESFALLVSYEW